ncbi:MAG: SPOR domain-containing protein [Paraglaciecola sp.]|uniref:SPOR domain-containing protein n=2 Tax=Paraglaciecola sp. TaxID=1920173 RepID=UPI0032637846
MSSDKYVCYLFLLMIFLCLLSPKAMAIECKKLANWQRVDINEDALLLPVLRLNGRPISASIDVFPHNDRFMVPVSSLESVFKLGWSIDIAAATFNFNNSSQLIDFCDFDIDLTEQDDPHGYFWARDDFDIYIDLRALDTILGGSYAFNYELLHLNIFNDKPFPGLKNEVNVTVPTFEGPAEMQPSRRVADQYHVISPPLIHYRVNGSHDSSLGTSKLSGNLNGFFDLFKHETELRINANQDTSNQYLRLSKNLDISGADQSVSLLRYELGDIQLHSDELIYSSKQGAGVSIFNFDPNYSRSFTTSTLEEVVLPGWRVQLFRNGQFIAEVFSDDENRAVFENVDTFYGNNLFEFKLYGPEGQQETRTQTINVGNEQLSPGRFNYLVNVSDASKRFIDEDNEESTFDKNVSGLISYGLTGNTTIEASVHSLQGAGQKQKYLSSALYMNFSAAAFKSQVVKDLSAGGAIFTGINTSLFDNRLRANLSYRIFNNFESDAYAASRDLKSETRTRFNGRLDWLKGASWGLNYLHRSYNNQSDDNVYSVNFNKNLLGGTFSTTLSRNEGIEDETLGQTLYWSKNFNGWQISNSMSWLPFDDQEVLNYYSNIRWPQQYSTYNESRIDYRPSREHKFELRHQLNWRRKQFNLQFGTTVNNGGEWTVNIGIAGDIEYNPYEKALDFYQPRGSNTANIRAFAFLDNNRNSIFDSDDSALNAVTVSGNHAWRELKTNKMGNIQLATTKREQRISIDDASLPDPYMSAIDEMVLVNTHKGGVNTVSLPVVTFNDIEGAVYRVKNNNSRGASDLKIRLINQDLELIAETISEVDGFFFFTQIPPGHYQIQVDPDFLTLNELTILNLPKIIEAPSEGDSVRINDLLLVNLVTSEFAEIVTSEQKELYFVQLGAFKKFRSIYEVIKYLPTDEFNLKIFRNHETAMSHVAIGGFKTIDEAKRAIKRITHIQPLKHIFITRGERYYSSGWDLEFQLNDFSDYINASHKKIKLADPKMRLCQLASYRSMTSIRQVLFDNQPNVHIVRRLVSGKRFYTLLGDLKKASKSCASEFQGLTPELPIEISIKKIVASLDES